MTPILRPARLEPTFSPRPWGVRSLAPFFPEKKNLLEPIGEAWLTGSECRFADGEFAAKALGEVWQQMPVEWTGTSVSRSGVFPILVKFIFPDDKLSVQVHPDDEYAARYEQAAGGLGKTEMWYAVEARAGAEVMVGMKSDVTRESFQRAIAENTAEQCIEHIPVSAGDAIFVPAGTVHTIGPGLVLCEIQEHSDLTYRVYDYNRHDANGRERPLHIEKALQVVRFGPQRGGKIEPVKIEKRDVTEIHFAMCRYFATEKWEFSKGLKRETNRERFELLIFLAGRGAIRSGGESAEYATAQVWLLPAALGVYELEPREPSMLLRTCVPGDLDEMARQLATRGVPRELSARLIHR
jgi:mannose-6-phosphate isomerase